MAGRWGASVCACCFSGCSWITLYLLSGSLPWHLGMHNILRFLVWVGILMIARALTAMPDWTAGEVFVYIRDSNDISTHAISWCWSLHSLGSSEDVFASHRIVLTLGFWIINSSLIMVISILKVNRTNIPTWTLPMDSWMTTFVWFHGDFISEPWLQRCNYRRWISLVEQSWIECMPGFDWCYFGFGLGHLVVAWCSVGCQCCGVILAMVLGQCLQWLVGYGFIWVEWLESWWSDRK